MLSGPDELRRAVLQSLLTWHFDKSGGLTSRTLSIDFVKPASTAGPGLDSRGLDTVEQQLGLKLVSAKGPVDVIVIDHIDKPSPN